MVSILAKGFYNQKLYYFAISAAFKIVKTKPENEKIIRSLCTISLDYQKEDDHVQYAKGT